MGIKIRIVILTLAICILCVEQPGIIPVFGPADHLHMVASVTAFVARRPDDHRREVLKYLHHPAHPVDMLIFPLCLCARPIVGLHIVIVRHVGKSAQESVGLNIRFADHIEADLVAHLHKGRGRRIMGGADAVHIQLLHKKEVLS